MDIRNNSPFYMQDTLLLVSVGSTQGVNFRNLLNPPEKTLCKISKVFLVNQRSKLFP